jgi:hypothetical protein
MHEELIGHVGVDSGQLLLCDPCYIDSEWEKEEFADIRVYEHKVTKDRLIFGKDFPHYQQPIDRYDGKNMNELNETGEWVEIDRPDPVHNFSYNACAQATLSSLGHGQLNYKIGHPGVGVAFRTAFGDGVYPVYAKIDDDGNIKSVEVVFIHDDVEEEDDFRTFNEAPYGND